LISCWAPFTAASTPPARLVSISTSLTSYCGLEATAARRASVALIWSSPIRSRLP
jgi:hypothetical protein